MWELEARSSEDCDGSNGSRKESMGNVREERKDWSHT